MAAVPSVTGAGATGGGPATPDWLTVDTTAAQAGYGPASYGDPATDPVAPSVPTGVSPLGAEDPQWAPAGEQVSPGPEGAGAWPSVPPDWNAGQYPVYRGDGPAQGVAEAELPHTGATGMWSNAEQLQTFDALSQHTTTTGWDVNVPNDRTSARNTWGQANPGNNPTWPPTAEGPAQAHLAIGAVPITADYGNGTPGVANGGLPDWAPTGSQGSIAYETPAPPQAAAPQPQQPAGYGYAAGWA